MKTTLWFPLLLLSLTGPMAPGALLYNDLATDSSGNFLNPGTTGWSGNGTVVGAAGFNTSSGATMINDFTGTGTLTLGEATGWGPPLVLPKPTGTMSVSLGGGGSADIAVNLSGPGGLRPIGFNVTDLQGVTSVTVEFNWTNPLAANWSRAIPAFQHAPFLVGFRTQGSGSPWNVDAEYLGLRHTSAVGGPFVGGLPGTANSIDMTSNANPGFQWGSGTSHSGTSNNTRWQGVHLFDLVGGDAIYDQAVNGDSTLQDAEAVYGTGMRFTFTPSSGTFLDGSNFLFSTNGAQYVDTFAEANAFVIPEPSRLLLLGFGLGSVLVRRRRRR